MFCVQNTTFFVSLILQHVVVAYKSSIITVIFIHKMKEFDDVFFDLDLNDNAMICDKHDP